MKHIRIRHVEPHATTDVVGGKMLTQHCYRVTTYSKRLGISRQGVAYLLRKNRLKTFTIDGTIFIYATKIVPHAPRKVPATSTA
jgi:hypothetical protein